ncbi:MAG TPA: glycosyltransferase family 1 protein [Acidimicrobiales bacterium]|nr:glycosyltransferase family 1 protein [Acidimicrobiales bacterium]
MSRTRVLMVVEQLRRATPGGIGTYARGLLQGLGELGPGETPDVELLASRPGHRRPESGDPLVGLAYPVHNSVLPGPLLTRAWDRGVLRAPAGFDVVHAVSLATLEPGPAALVSTIHDLLWRRLPDAYPPRGRAWHEAALQRALHRADHFIVTSDPVAADLVNAGADPAAISVVPMGCDHLPPPDLEAGASLLQRIGVHGPFLLSVGTLEPRKNLPRLTEAYQRIRGSLPEPWPLVMVGPSGWGEKVQSGPGVVPAGMVTPGELSALYSMTQLLAYVPLIEGFGLPPVEAMVFGTPVVASPLPSTAGAAFEVDPRDIESIAWGLLTVATDTTVRSRLEVAGRHRAGELKWSTIARRHVSVWDAAASRNRGHRHG